MKKHYKEPIVEIVNINMQSIMQQASLPGNPKNGNAVSSAMGRESNSFWDDEE